MEKGNKESGFGNLSRREFLKQAGIVVGGVAIGSLTLASACDNSGTSTTAPTATNPTTMPPTNTNIGTSGMIDVPGCASKVAPDRLYSIDHAWVKSLGNNVVQIGMSDPFQVLADRVNTCWLSPEGTVLSADTPFGSIEADKLNVDLISPVSGKVIRTNTTIMAIPNTINLDPYANGWMLDIELTKPAELDKLVSPRYYAYLQALSWTGPIPPKR